MKSCPHCGVNIKDQQDMDEHMESNHPDKMCNNCESCGIYFHSIRSQARHKCKPKTKLSSVCMNYVRSTARGTGSKVLHVSTGTAPYPAISRRPEPLGLVLSAGQGSRDPQHAPSDGRLVRESCHSGAQVCHRCITGRRTRPVITSSSGKTVVLVWQEERGLALIGT